MTARPVPGDRRGGSHRHVPADINGFDNRVGQSIAAASLDDFSDVSISSPSVGQVLKWNGSAWVNDDDALGGGSSWVSATVTVPGFKGAFEHRQTISEGAATGSSVVALKLAPALDTDENDPEMLDVQSLVAIPGSGYFDVLMTFASPTSGQIKLHYQVS